MVVSPDQEAIGTYFEGPGALERMLERQGRTALLERMPDFSKTLNITYVTQAKPLGNGHAVLVAKQEVGERAVRRHPARRRHPGRRLNHRSDDRHLPRNARPGHRRRRDPR